MDEMLYKRKIDGTFESIEIEEGREPKKMARSVQYFWVTLKNAQIIKSVNLLKGSRSFPSKNLNNLQAELSNREWIFSNMESGIDLKIFQEIDKDSEVWRINPLFSPEGSTVALVAGDPVNGGDHVPDGLYTGAIQETQFAYHMDLSLPKDQMPQILQTIRNHPTSVISVGIGVNLHTTYPFVDPDIVVIDPLGDNLCFIHQLNIKSQIGTHLFGSENPEIIKLGHPYPFKSLEQLTSEKILTQLHKINYWIGLLSISVVATVAGIFLGWFDK